MLASLYKHSTHIEGEEEQVITGMLPETGILKPGKLVESRKPLLHYVHPRGMKWNLNLGNAPQVGDAAVEERLAGRVSEAHREKKK